ncbi:MAG: hypothetical protein HZY77_00960 [Thiobacillus sp.]|uniref:hypothetical protein n=1 Tax=Thiobacillus sp. TaxID=924 RepID=UPI00168C4F7F|nr:hypothetical protein [Thiobacillus sp.]QLQ01659.1 MAG: hypothetical protein HZY77_00960 [Thiobacillus sp.]
MALKLVTQANLTDCGLACVAIVAGKSLETVLRVAIKECGYPKDGPHTTTDDSLFKLLDHFGIKYGKKQKVKTVEALPPVAIMETRKMPSTGNSHLVVFERTPEGDEHALDPGWWLKQQIRSDWNRIKLDTFIPIYLPEPATKTSKKKTAEPPTATEAETSASQSPAKKAKPPKSKASGKKSTANTATNSEQEPTVKDAQGDAQAEASTLVQPEETGTALIVGDESKADNTPAQEPGDVA